MISARSASVIVRGHESRRRQLGRRREDAPGGPARERRCAGSSGGRVGRPCAGHAPPRGRHRARGGTARSGERRPRRAADRRRGARGTGGGGARSSASGSGASSATRDGRDRRPRQHRAALDQDELAGDRHERADVAEAIGLERGERVEIGVGEGAERDRQDVELARLDERQQQRQRAVELGDLDLGRGLRPAALAEATASRRGARGRAAMTGDAGSRLISWPRPRAAAAPRTPGRAARPGSGSARRSAASSRPSRRGPPRSRRGSRRRSRAGRNPGSDAATRQIHAP